MVAVHISNKFFTALTGVLLALGLSACTSNPDSLAANDPLEPFNREMFKFNSALDDVALEPASKAYVAVTPKFGRTMFRNVMTTLNQPVVFANTTLQGDLEGSAITLARFGMNATLGVAGLFDVATHAGIPERHEDFGQTLAVWGVEDGPYLMMPIFGPSNVRDGIGRGVDRFGDPLNWNDDYPSSSTKWTVGIVNGLDQRAQAQDAIEALERTAIDPYIQLRRSYAQRRNMAITNGEEDYADLPEFE